MISSEWTSVLCCSGCGGSYNVTPTSIECPRCSVTFPVVDGIPVVIKDAAVGTALVASTYDEQHLISQNTVANDGARWKQIIDHLGLEPESAMEIGAGTGLLTQGLLDQGAVGKLIVTDVSHTFLEIIARRTNAHPTPVSFVACDANEQHFKPESFDLTVGRSVLHHLLDYELTLRHHCSMLKPGGVSVFLEPVLEGKTMVTLLASLLVTCDEQSSTPHLDPEERQRIRRVIRHQMKAKLVPQDRESLAKMEDKYIFEIPRMKEVGKNVGFSDVEFINYGDVDPSYWPYLSRILQMHGVPQARIEPYKWLGSVLADTYGRMFSESLATPMGFFVFRK